MYFTVMIKLIWPTESNFFTARKPQPKIKISLAFIWIEYIWDCGSSESEVPIKTVVLIEVNPNFWFSGNESFFEVDDDILIKLHYLKLNICIIDTAEFILKPLIKTLESEGNLNLETFTKSLK